MTIIENNYNKERIVVCRHCKSVLGVRPDDIKYDSDHIRYDDNKDENKYGCSDSQFRLKKAGLYANIKPESDIFKGVNIYYGFDLSNKTRWFNTLIGQVMFPCDVTANVAVGIKTENMLIEDYIKEAQTLIISI